jgi:hypothetical protein
MPSMAVVTVLVVVTPSTAMPLSLKLEPCAACDWTKGIARRDRRRVRVVGQAGDSRELDELVAAGRSLVSTSCLPATPLITSAETPALAPLIASRMFSGVAPSAIVISVLLCGLLPPSAVEREGQRAAERQRIAGAGEGRRGSGATGDAVLPGELVHFEGVGAGDGAR